ncbi:hypothetical protein H490_0101215 [Leucobacter sp. UCD-THU]|uniref:peptidase C39 family protein n=1 Tax=Leucobacter sp. UCD-THU TaxID=1292023 RepID=UPI000363495D|nr:peptidase C39 family protein [Leucobacter sp. UCD-THU]EYT56657.1 hypothetical protein H490_0101215 [Leucobacter sp. UCD-THU]
MNADDRTSHSIEARSGAELPSSLRAGLPQARLALWEVERELWAPRTLLWTDADGSVLGAALTAGRPFTAYRKIVDVVAPSERVWRELVGAARFDAPPVGETRPQPVVVHFEEQRALAPLTGGQREALSALGFTSAPKPVPSVPSTRAGDPAEVAAWSHWLGERPTRLAPYYGQTTEVTCGAVSSLMALESRGRDGFSPSDLAANRTAEISFWRRITNLPACEPVGLAVETAETGVLPELPRVVLSTTEPVLLEEFENDADRALRIDLQHQALRRAEELGLPIERRWIEVEEIARLVQDGAQVLLLIDLTELIADPTPHWVLAADVVHDSDDNDVIILSDPWIHYPNGETWVDTYALPLPLPSVDRVTRWGAPAYRGVVVLPA